MLLLIPFYLIARFEDILKMLILEQICCYLTLSSCPKSRRRRYNISASRLKPNHNFNEQCTIRLPGFTRVQIITPSHSSSTNLLPPLSIFQKPRPVSSAASHILKSFNHLLEQRTIVPPPCNLSNKP